MNAPRYSAQLFDRAHPTGHAATAWVTPGGLHVESESGAEHATWSFDSIQLAGRPVRGEPVRFERGTPVTETLVVADAGILGALRTASPTFGARVPSPRAGLTASFALGMIGTALATMVALYVWGIPALAILAAEQVPVEWERSLGESALASLAPPEKRIEDPRVIAPVETIVARLHAASGAAYRFRVVVVDQPEVNALAAPGGNIVVFRGLLESSESPEEVAGVLAHEIQHVLRRHVVRALLQRASLAVIVSLLAGDASGALATQLAQGLGDLSYSRSLEDEADAAGYGLMRRASVDPAGMPLFLERLEKKQRDPSWLEFLSTHPATGARAKRLRARIATDSPVVARAVVEPGTWQEMRQALRSRKTLAP